MATSKITPPSEDAVVAHLRHTYSAADHQTFMAVQLGTTTQAAQLPELVAAAAGDAASFVRTHLAKHVTVKFAPLVAKLRKETPHNLEVLQKYIKEACDVETDFLVDDDGVPNINALRRVGLVAPSGPTAWGFAVVRTKNLVADEWVLRNHPNHVPTVQGSLAEVSRQIVELTHQMRGTSAQEYYNPMMICRLYSVTKATGWFNFRVEENDDGGASVVEIKTRALFDDICRNSRGVHRENDPKMPSIQGVNAPPFFR
jgi:hypothetical protein